MAGIPRDKTQHYVVYDVTLVNTHMKQISFRYVVPEGKEPHPLLKDLHFFSKKTPRVWIEVHLRWSEQLKQFQIISLREIVHKTQEEIEQESLKERGGRVTLT